MKKIEQLTPEKIIELASNPSTFTTRKNFNFDLTNDDVKKALVNVEMPHLRIDIGKLIAKICLYRDTYLDLPIIFSNYNVINGFGSVITRGFVLSHTLSDVMTKEYIKQLNIGTLRRYVFITPSRIINDLCETYPIGVSNFIRYNISYAVDCCYYNVDREECLDKLAKILDDQLFTIFIKNVYYLRPSTTMSKCVTEYMWNRVVSLMSSWKNDAEKIREYTILSDYCTELSKSISYSIENNRIGVKDKYVFFNKKYFDQLNNLAHIHIHCGSKKFLNLFIDSGLIEPDDCDDYFSVDNNFDNFVKNDKISDNKIISIIKNGYVLRISQLNVLSEHRPDVFTAVAKDSLINSIKTKVLKNITGDVKKLIDAELIHLNIDVELEDSDLLNLYLQLNTDK